MLNAQSGIAPNRRFHAERETSMDCLDAIETVSFSNQHRHETPRSNNDARAAVLMAIVVAMTLITILALDYASIHLPTGSDELFWPPFG